MKYLFFMVSLIALLSCDQNRLFEENKKIGNKFWYVDSLMTFNFQVPDSTQLYDIYANFSHSSDYNFHNLYFKYVLIDSTEKQLLEELVNVHFFDPKSGVPLGKGLGDVFDHQYLILENYAFKKEGSFSFSFQQYMRTDSLPAIRTVGLRIAKSTAD